MDGINSWCKLHITCLLLWLSLTAHGQADSILSLPQDHQMNALYTWFEANLSGDTATILPRMKDMSKIFRAEGRSDLVKAVFVIRVNYLIHAWQPNSRRIMNVIDEAVEETDRRNWQKEKAELYILKGMEYQRHQQLVNAFTYFIRGYELMKQSGLEQYPRFHNLVFNIGYAYYSVKAYDEAIYYIHQAVRSDPPRRDTTFSTVAYNTLGLCYLRELKYDSAFTAFNMAYANAVKNNIEGYVGLIRGNIGYVHYKMGNDDIALPFLEEDFNLSLAANEIGSALHASLALSAIYLKKGLHEKADFHLRFATQHVNRADNIAMKSYYDNLMDVTRLSGDFGSAMMYRDSAELYQQRIQAAQEQDILERARLKVEIQKHSGNIITLEALRKRQVMLRNGLLVFLFVTGGIILAIVQRRYRRGKIELEEARKELTLFTDTIREKNVMLDAFSREFETLKASHEGQSEERYEHLAALLNSHILTEDDWTRFRKLFDKVHPGFFVRLKEMMPDLTPAETRLLALSKLNMAYREMASMLGISYDSIIKTRQRMMKKINLPEDGTLEDLLRKF